METVRHALSFLFVLLEVVLIFNLMIVVHELGHFLAARWRGLHVDRFYVWFGKPLWKKTIRGVEYGLGSIPFGGYVALPQMAPMPESLEGPHGGPTREQLPPVGALDKIIVAFAGPLFSFLLAAVFAVIVWGVGKPVSERETTTTVGYVLPGGPADKAGMKPGDEIERIDGRGVSRWMGLTDSVVWGIVRSEGETFPIEIRRNGQPLTLQLKPYFEPRAGWQRRSTRQILVEPAISLIAARVQPGSAAAQADLQAGDVIRAAEGQRLYSTYALLDAESAHAGGPVRLEVQRGEQTLEKTIQAPAYLKIGTVLEGSPAAQAGLKAGDEIVALNGEAMKRFAEFSEKIKSGGEQPVHLTLRRNGSETLEKTLTPQRPENRPKADPMVGIGWNFNADGILWDDGGLSHFAYPSPAEQLSGSVATIGNTLGALLSPKSDIGLGLLSGPVGIGHGYYNLLTSEQGWRLALWFSVVLNVNLALMNLLPIPILDGGHITLAIVEAIRRKPVNLRVLEFIQTGCFVLIVGVALYITFFDVGDFADGGGRGRLKFRQAAANAPPASSPAATASAGESKP